MAFKLNYLWRSVQVAHLNVYEPKHIHLSVMKVREKNTWNRIWISKEAHEMQKLERESVRVWKKCDTNCGSHQHVLWLFRQNDHDGVIILYQASVHRQTEAGARKRMQKRKWGKKGGKIITQTKNTQMCEKTTTKLCLSMHKTFCNNTAKDLSTEPMPQQHDAETIFAPRMHGNHTIHQVQISMVIILAMAIIFLSLSISWLFGSFAHIRTDEKLRDASGQLHNLTPCYSKCILLNFVRRDAFSAMHTLSHRKWSISVHVRCSAALQF